MLDIFKHIFGMKNHSKEGAEPLLWVGPLGRGFGGRAELQAAAAPALSPPLAAGPILNKD